MKGAILASVLLVSSVASAETRPRYGGSIEGTLLGAPATLDPADARTHAEVTVAGLVTDTLYRVASDGTVEPHLAAELPTFDEKRTTVYVPVRKNIRMHDGSDLTPADVAASLQHARGSARWLLAGLVGVKVDGDGVVLSLRAPLPDLLVQLAQPQLGIVRAGSRAERPIGSGPYAFESLDRARRTLRLRAFDEHFAGRPYLDGLVLVWHDTPDGEARRFETGKAQVSARGATAFAGGKPTVRSRDIEGPAALLVYVGFGTAHRDVLGDRAFRRALDLALARGGLTAITAGERVLPTRVPVPVESGGLLLDAAGKASDLDRARAALADAAKRVPSLAESRLASLRLEILVEDTRPDDREIAERVVLALDKLGIAAVITALAAPALRDRVAKGTCDLWVGQLAAPVGGGALWWGAAFALGGDDAAVVADPAREFTARLPIVPLMFRSVKLWHAAHVHGIAFDALARPSYADVSVFGAPQPNKGRRP